MSRFIKFVITGVINTINYYVFYLLLLKIFHLPYIISHLSAFLFAFVISYFINCYFVYHVTPSIKTFLQFPLTQVINMTVQTILMILFVDYMHWTEELAPFAALIITVPITYMMTTFILEEKQ